MAWNPVRKLKKAAHQVAPYASAGVMLAPLVRPAKDKWRELTGEAQAEADAKRAAAQNRRDVSSEAAALAHIQQIYGINPKPGVEDPVAMANKAALDTLLASNRNAALTEGTGSLNDQFGTAWRGSQQRLGAQGLAGGSVDRSAKRRLLANLFKGRTNLALGADSATRTARRGIDQQRMELERQVKLGTAPNLSAIHAVDDTAGDINSAYHGLGQQAIGDLFANAGNAYYTGQEAAGAGRAGPAAFSLTRRRPSTTGTYL